MTINANKKKQFLYSVLPFIVLIVCVVFYIVDLYEDSFLGYLSFALYIATMSILIYILYKSIISLKKDLLRLIINDEGILDLGSLYSLETLLPWSYVDRIISKKCLGTKYIAVYLNEAGRRAYISELKTKGKRPLGASPNILVSPVYVNTFMLEKSHEEIYEFMLAKLNEYRGESAEKSV